MNNDNMQTLLRHRHAQALRKQSQRTFAVVLVVAGAAIAAVIAIGGLAALGLIVAIVIAVVVFSACILSSEISQSKGE
jgi:hypothetical protein